MTNHFRSPLTIYVLWHPKFEDGEKLADRLFSTLSRNVNDPFKRTIGIPVYYRSEPHSPGSEAPAPIPLEESDFNAIVVFVDTNMLLSDDWTEYTKNILKEKDKDSGRTRVFPMANDFTAFNSKQLGNINYIRLYEADTREDMDTVNEDGIYSDDTEIVKRETDLRDREARLAEREKALIAGGGNAGVSLGVQPAVQGDGVNINITINSSGTTGSTGETSGVTAAPDSLRDKANAESAAVAQALSDEETIRRRGNLMLSRLLHELCRLINSLPEVTDAGTTTSARPVNLFLSHAKADGAEIAKQIKRFIENDASMKTFFDANDIAAGYDFSNELKSAIETSALICIQTDYYATREWCLFEVITAKRFDRPVVVLNAVKQREPRSFPYIGNVPTMRWNPKAKSRFRELIDLALFEVLANTYNDMFQKALLKLYKIPRDSIHSVGHAPELFSILQLRDKGKNRGSDGPADTTKYILYPDPPLGDGEIQLLQDLSPDMQFITPTMLPVIEHQVNSK